MASLIDRLVQALIRRLGEHFEPQIDAVRDAAGEAIEDLDDRVRLFRLELQAETGRLARMGIYAAAAVVGAIASLLWVCAGAILLAWDTDYRTTAIIAVIALWTVATAFSIGMLRSLAQKRRDAFRLSRALLAADAATARQYLRERDR